MDQFEGLGVAPNLNVLIGGPVNRSSSAGADAADPRYLGFVLPFSRLPSVVTWNHSRSKHTSEYFSEFVKYLCEHFPLKPHENCPVLLRKACSAFALSQPEYKRQAARVICNWMYGKQDDFERIHSNIKTWVRDLHAGKFAELDLEEITKGWIAAGRTLQSPRLMLGEALSRRIIDPAGPPGPRALYADMEAQVRDRPAGRSARRRPLLLVSHGARAVGGISACVAAVGGGRLRCCAWLSPGPAPAQRPRPSGRGQ
jgi:hypothetical protein